MLMYNWNYEFQDEYFQQSNPFSLSFFLDILYNISSPNRVNIPIINPNSSYY